MATTIPAAFTQLKTNLEITGLQKATVSERQKNVRECVSKGLIVLDSFLTGSYARSTMISPLTEADVDVFIVLDPSYYSDNGHAALLDRVRQVTLRTYTKTPKISRNGQAVTITFTDFVVDVVPAFYRTGGGYLIPSSTEKKWISTDPTVHETYISTQNKSHNGDLIPMIKMLKGWNKKNGEPLRSFYLELLASDIYNNVIISDYPSGARFFFDKGREKVKYTAKDPVLFGKTIQGINNGSVQQAVDKFQRFYDISLQAERYAKAGSVHSAIDEWRKVFGSYFPAYG